MKRRVVVTGMGCVSPFGVGVETLWNNLKKGESGIKYLNLDFGGDTDMEKFLKYTNSVIDESNKRVTDLENKLESRQQNDK